MSALERQLRGFAAYVRDPHAHEPPPGIEQRRLQVYRDLVLRNLGSLLATGFPVVRRTLQDAQWQALLRDFLARHRSHTPLFPEIAQEFLTFLQRRQAEGAGDPPWLGELAHYEWVELALQVSDASAPAHDAGGDLLAGRPLRSPLAWPLAYRWPVQAIGPGHVPDVPPSAPTLLLVRRDGDGQVHFSALSPAAYRLLELLGAEDHASGREVLERLAAEAGADDREAFIAQGAAMLQRLRLEGVLLGTHP